MIRKLQAAGQKVKLARGVYPILLQFLISVPGIRDNAFRRIQSMKIRNKQTAGTLMALAGGVCWGFSGCCGQFLFEQKGIQVPWLVTVRLFFAGILLILAGFRVNGRDNFNILRRRQDALHLLVFAIFGITFCQFTYFMAIRASNAGTATVLQYLSPVLILFVMCIRGRRLPKGLELGAIGLSLFGTFILGTHGDLHAIHISGEALFWGLLAAVSAVIYTMIPGGLILKYDIYQVLGFGMLAGGIVMGILVRPWTYHTIWDWGTAAALGGVIVVGTALSFSLFLQGVSLIGPLRGSIMGSVEPVSAVIISVFWLNTSFALADFIGFALILGAVFVLTFSQRPRGVGEGSITGD